METGRESFKLELIMENGQITEIHSLDPENVFVSDPKPTLEEVMGDEKELFMRSLRHGTMLLMGQNSPGWVVYLTPNGYVRVWR